LIPLGLGLLGNDPDTSGVKAIRHYNSVFHQLLEHVPWEEFDALVMERRADARVRRLTTKSQFLVMLYGQLAGAVSLHEIVGGIGYLQKRAGVELHVMAGPS
jgi:Domain of unknown function (DUF4372)